MCALKLPVLHGKRLLLRPPLAADAVVLTAILQEPEVAFWWVNYDLQKVQDTIIARPDTHYVIEYQGECAGVVVVLRSADAEYPTTVMHIFLTTKLRGIRLGEEALAVAINAEFAAGITRVTLDPNINNAAAIRSYERLGFQRIGVLRDYQVRPDGTLDDALFMDLTHRDFPGGLPLPVM